MKYSKYFAFIVFLLASNTSLFSIANWTIMIYMQSNNNLSSFAAKNIKAMTAVGSNKNLNTLVQWRKSPTNDIWRYKVNKSKYVLEQKK